MPDNDIANQITRTYSYDEYTEIQKMALSLGFTSYQARFVENIIQIIGYKITNNFERSIFFTDMNDLISYIMESGPEIQNFIYDSLNIWKSPILKRLDLDYGQRESVYSMLNHCSKIIEKQLDLVNFYPLNSIKIISNDIKFLDIDYTLKLIGDNVDTDY